MSPMPDADDDHGASVLVDAKHDPVVASTSAAIAVQLASQRLAEPLWVVSKRPRDEFDDCRGDLARQTLQVPARGPGSLDLVRQVGLRH